MTNTTVLSPRKINTQKFALYTGLASIVMLFAALTSAYIVKKYDTDWLHINFPAAFYISSGIIIISSFFMYRSVRAYREAKYNEYKLMMTTTLILGYAFVLLQYLGYVALMKSGVTLKGNPAGSFLYVISWLHLAHVVGGLAFLKVATWKAWRRPYNPNRLNAIEITSTYWHFVGGLWIYLFIFFLSNNP